MDPERDARHVLRDMRWKHRDLLGFVGNKAYLSRKYENKGQTNDLTIRSLFLKKKPAHALKYSTICQIWAQWTIKRPLRQWRHWKSMGGTTKTDTLRQIVTLFSTEVNFHAILFKKTLEIRMQDSFLSCKIVCFVMISWFYFGSDWRLGAFVLGFHWKSVVFWATWRAVLYEWNGIPDQNNFCWS